MIESPTDFLKSAGIKYKLKAGGKEARFPCPMCGESEGFGLNLLTGQWGCFRASCGAKGNLYQLKVALGAAYQVTQSTAEPIDPTARLAAAFEPRSTITHEQWHGYLLESKAASVARDYLESRGLSQQLINMVRLGWIPRHPTDTKNKGKMVGQGMIAIPYLGGKDGAQCAMVKLRTVPPIHKDGKRYMRVKGGESVLYAPIGWHTGRTVLVCGGEFDALSVVQSALDANLQDQVWKYCEVVPVSIPDGEGNWSPVWTEQLAQCEDVVLCYDNDQAGRIGAKKAAEAIGAWRCRIARWPAAFKDGNEAYTKGGLPWQTIVDLVVKAESPASAGIIGAVELTDKVLNRLFCAIDPRGFDTGWLMLNRLIGGFRVGETTLLTGQTGAGKTTWALDAAYRQWKQKRLVLVCPFESGPTFSLIRLVRRHRGLEPATLGKEGCSLAISELAKGFLFLDHEGAIDVAAFRETLKYCVRSLGVSFVVVDHLHFMTKRNDKQYDEQDQIVFDCQSIISRSEAHCLLLAHPSKVKVHGSKNNDDHIVGLSDVKGRATAIQDIPNVLSMYRPRTHDRKDFVDDNGLLHAAIVSMKQRDEYGSEGMLELRLDKARAQFFDEWS